MTLKSSMTNSITETSENLRYYDVRYIIIVVTVPKVLHRSISRITNFQVLKSNEVCHDASTVCQSYWTRIET